MKKDMDRKKMKQFDDQYAIKVNSKLEDAINTGDRYAIDAAKKRLQNWEWYRANREKKKAYNRQYYLDNLEYWRNRYANAKNRANALAKSSTEPDSTDRRSTSRVIDAKLAREYQHRADVMLDNLKRAEKEYANFLELNKKMPLSEAIKQGRDVIRETGRKFIRSLVGNIDLYKKTR